jgi:hypothetical protein
MKRYEQLGRVNPTQSHNSSSEPSQSSIPTPTPSQPQSKVFFRRPFAPPTVSNSQKLSFESLSQPLPDISKSKDQLLQRSLQSQSQQLPFGSQSQPLPEILSQQNDLSRKQAEKRFPDQHHQSLSQQFSLSQPLPDIMSQGIEPPKNNPVQSRQSQSMRLSQAHTFLSSQLSDPLEPRHISGLKRLRAEQSPDATTRRNPVQRNVPQSDFGSTLQDEGQGKRAKQSTSISLRPKIPDETASLFRQRAKRIFGTDKDKLNSFNEYLDSPLMFFNGSNQDNPDTQSKKGLNMAILHSEIKELKDQVKDLKVSLSMEIGGAFSKIFERLNQLEEQVCRGQGSTFQPPERVPLAHHDVEMASECRSYQTRSDEMEDTEEHKAEEGESIQTRDGLQSRQEQDNDETKKLLLSPLQPSQDVGASQDVIASMLWD